MSEVSPVDVVDRQAVKRLHPIARGFLIAFGTLCVGLGVIGILVPGMPSTVFFLIAAACYVRSSERLYHKLLSNRAIGQHIRNFREKRAMPRRAKILALAMGWTAILLSTFLAFESWPLRGVMLMLGAIMTVVILSVKTLQAEDPA
jgi:uncharacterized membrane protein YbaN (DUF454 family)